MSSLTLINQSFWTTLPAIVRKLKGIKAFVTLLFDETGNLEPVWQLSHSLVDSRSFQLAIATMRENPEVANILAERYIASPHDLVALSQYPPDSLGYAYASQMKELAFQPIEAGIEINSDTSYVENRWQQTHDIWHIITGFETSEIGEIGLQAFYLAQFQLPLASLLIANALIAVTVWQPQRLSVLLMAIARGWEMGKNAKPLIAQKWEEAWEKPVTVWRKELNVQPVNPNEFTFG
ncbi:ubiquinone biosynthesis protein [Nostoc sp. MBR 210]|uniref:Ubiquinone biosynthesis protein n=1 Tax=Nostoc spongiaeforme FACHB-130 TaxID=1357510 RepID=A0ABR8FYV2_9NOSO|nr:Coq4 family protein [Nostoc spongiaeforme]MBD2595916.1 ubiquinone biosynthesis protein [Nostoc spongiaeforme FACHB-130]OCQ99571.1 ubiquinone biosynthesis protein [Nostoc sp. MBR 210]